jgi:hypothetical protein
MMTVSIPVAHRGQVYRALSESETNTAVVRVAEKMRHGIIAGDNLIIEVTDEEAAEAARWVASFPIIGKFCAYFVPDDVTYEDRLGVFVR